MQQILMQRLFTYMTRNNPDLLIRLQSETRVTAYLEEKTATVMPMVAELLDDGCPINRIEEICMDDLTGDLRPSKYNLISSVLAEEFEHEYTRMVEAGTLTHEVINIISACEPVLEQIQLTEDNAEDRFIHYALTGAIKEYLAG